MGKSGGQEAGVNVDVKTGAKAGAEVKAQAQAQVSRGGENSHRMQFERNPYYRTFGFMLSSSLI